MIRILGPGDVKNVCVEHCSGSILIDGTNIAHIDVAELRSIMAAVSESPVQSTTSTHIGFAQVSQEPPLFG